MTLTTSSGTGLWTEVCSVAGLTPDRGVAALVDGEPVAVFLLSDCGADGDGEVLAIDHVDPFHGVGVLARGLVGSVGDRAVVASPLLKQRFDLRTGECLDDPSMAVRTWDVEVDEGSVRVRRR
jgi:nitrite reductase (NADH) small subunit